MLGMIRNSGGFNQNISKMGRDAFLQYCRKRHKYIYKYVIKECNQDKTVFLCPYHGKQTVEARRHMNGLGCRQCLAEPNKNYQDFLKLANQRHGMYKYPKAFPLYSLLSRITIKCKLHGEFTKMVAAHLNSEGCPWCSKGMLSKKQFVKIAKKKHNDRYDYEAVPDGILKGKVKIRCKSHGWFSQYPQSHVEGSGCMDCAYTDRNPGVKHFYLYLFECRKGNKRFYKPGLANDVERRGKEHARALAKGWTIKLLRSYKINEHHGAYSTELYILKNLPGRPVSKSVMAVGHTETKYNKLSQKAMIAKMDTLVKSYVRKSKKHVHSSQKLKR